MYRAYTKDGYVMYRNLLVSYEVDSNGYYSLTTADKIVPSDGEKVIKAADYKDGYYLAIDPALEIMSIVDKEGNPITIKDENDKDVKLDNIIANGSSIIYYPYIKEDDETAGNHVFIDFYLGSEIPKDFNNIELTSDTYLTVDEKTGYYVISTAMVALKGFDGVGTTSKKDHYRTDARLHLIALEDSYPLYDEIDGEVYANYYFQGIYDGIEVKGMNKKQKYSSKTTEAFTAGIYAWDEEKKNYVEIFEDEDITSYSVENIEKVIADISLIFTDDNTSGLKLNETTKIIAIKDIPDPDNSDEEFLFEEIALEDLDTLLTTIGEYNDLNTASEKLEAKIGTYVDENKKTQVAYIIVDWVEYNEELEAYTFKGETK